jgi:hypothetical protein
LRFNKSIPDTAEDVTAEALLALRSCLDQTGYAATIASGKVKPTSTCFPITSGTPTDLDNLIRRRCVDLPDQIKSIFRGFNAHKGGNFPLCVLNELRNAVHTVFVPAVVFAADRKIQIPSTKFHWEVPEPPIWNSAKNEIIYLWTDPGADADYDVEISLNVTFADVEGIDRTPAATVLWQMLDAVAPVLNNTENACRRLGFI